MEFNCVCSHDQNLQRNTPGTIFQFKLKARQPFARIIEDFLMLIFIRGLRVISCLNASKLRIKGKRLAKTGWRTPPRKWRGSYDEQRNWTEIKINTNTIAGRRVLKIRLDVKGGG